MRSTLLTIAIALSLLGAGVVAWQQFRLRSPDLVRAAIAQRTPPARRSSARYEQFVSVGPANDASSGERSIRASREDPAL
jgi:hypothetical protein